MTHGEKGSLRSGASKGTTDVLLEKISGLLDGVFEMPTAFTFRKQSRKTFQEEGAM